MVGANRLLLQVGISTKSADAGLQYLHQALAEYVGNRRSETEEPICGRARVQVFRADASESPGCP